MGRFWFGSVTALLLCAAGPAAAVSIVAAESAYADIARQIAGPGASVTAILTNPAVDPHDFEPAPSTARRVADADIVILNGAGYDPWIAGLLPPSATPIVVADLLGRHAGDNPHLWYDPLAMPALARALATRLCQADPAHPGAILARRDAVLASLAVLGTRIAALRARLAGREVAATEPVFAPMLQAIGLADTHARFELAAMNGAEPRAGDVASLQADLQAHRISAFVTNAQAASPASLRLLGIAKLAGVPIVQVTETLPPGRTYQAWVGTELDALEAALSIPPRQIAR